MAVQIQLRRGSASYWTAANPTLAQGEMGIELDTGRFKVGNGTSTWTLLGYSSGAVHFVDFPEVDDISVGNPNDGEFLQFSTVTNKWIATTTVKSLFVDSIIPSTSPTTGGLVVAGGMGVVGDINVQGNITFSGTASIAVAEGNFFGDDFGFGALYAGLTSFTPLDQTVFQLTANTSTFAQVNFQNINSGTESSTDFVLTNDIGDQNSNYIDLGVNSSNYNNINYTATGPNDGYLYVASSNLVVGTALPGTRVRINVGGTLDENVTVNIYEPHIESTSTNTGALTVAGGVGITGNISAGGVGYFGAASPLTLYSPMAVFTADVDSYSQVQIQNKNAGTSASADITITTDDGTESTNYINLGIKNSQYSSGFWTVSGPRDGYLYVADNNLTIGTDNVGTTVKVHVGGIQQSDVVAIFREPTTNTTSSDTGAVVINGGFGVNGDTHILNTLHVGANPNFNLQNTLIIGTADINDFAQVSIQNRNNGISASSDFVATSDNGNDLTNYIDLGINNSGYSNSYWTISGPNDGYLYVSGNNLTLGTDSTGTAVKIHVGGTLFENIVAIFNEANTESTSTSTGAFVVNGGASVGGNLYVAGEIVAQKLTIEYTTITTTIIQTDDIIKTTNNTASTSSTTGALIIAGGAGIGGDLYVGGTIHGAIAGFSTTATQIQTIGSNSVSAHYLTFVDSNNSSPLGELLYTTSSVTVNPNNGNVNIKGNLQLENSAIVGNGTTTSVYTSLTTLDLFSVSVYRSAKYVISISNSGLGEFQTSDVLLVHNGTNSYVQANSVFSGNSVIMNFNTIISGGNVLLQGIGVGTGINENVVKIQKTYITI